MRTVFKLLALEVLRQLHADLMSRLEVQRIVGREGLDDVVVGAAIGLVEEFFHRFELIEGCLRHAVHAGDETVRCLLPVGDVVQDALQTPRGSNEFAERGAGLPASASGRGGPQIASQGPFLVATHNTTPG